MAPRIKERYKAAKAYFLATQAVSRPVALLMVFFALALLASASTGVFLLGRWGYRKVVNVDSSAVVTVPESDGSQSDNLPVSNTEAKPEQPKPSPTQSSNQSEVSNNSLPNTGNSPVTYLGVFVLGVFAHQVATRKKLTRD